MSLVFTAISSMQIHPPFSSNTSEERLSIDEFANQIIANGSFTFRAGTTTILTGTDRLLTWRASKNKSIERIQFIFEDALMPFGYGVKQFDQSLQSYFTTSDDHSILTIKPAKELQIIPLRFQLYTTIPNLFKRMIATNRLTLWTTSLNLSDIPKNDLDKITTPQELIKHLSLYMPQDTIQNIIFSTDDANLQIFSDTNEGYLQVVTDSGFTLTLVPKDDIALRATQIEIGLRSLTL